MVLAVAFAVWIVSKEYRSIVFLVILGLDIVQRVVGAPVSVGYECMR